MASMEYLTNSLLTSMSTTNAPSTVGGPNGRFPFNPSLLVSHPDDAIQKKYEEKLKAAEEHLIRLKSIHFPGFPHIFYIILILNVCLKVIWLELKLRKMTLGTN
jgi:hypothetical protein